MRLRLASALCVAAVCVGNVLPTQADGAHALAPAQTAAANREADAPSSRSSGAPTKAPRAPNRSPLTSLGADKAEAEGEGISAQGDVDPLVSNGLGSPSCKRAQASELSSLDKEHCETSGFVASAAPTDNYGIDVHIDTGPLGVTEGWLSSTVQDVVVSPIWMGLVWAVHALVVMLEWSFTIDLIPSATAGGLGKGLRQMEASFTTPWLPLVLVAASMLALYRGLIRRRVAETIGEAALMVTLMLAGLWVISDPTGTIGALGGWVNQAALGTLAVAAQGSPSSPGRALGTSLDTVFASAVEGPWCYLEFGDVGWCREPSRVDPRLRSSGIKIADSELAQIGCRTNPFSSVPCVPAGSESAAALQHSAEMLRSARTNGAIFLALPPNGRARNSINDQDSLLRTMCESSTVTSCRGAAAGEAQFRTSGQTFSRLSGLLLIAAGLLGMLLLLGSLALRLLAAALFSLLYLLLAPAVVLTPAFGEAGRSLFRKWGLQLLGATVAKLLFSFLLGVVLALVAMISNLTALGWWTQWLLTSALWWGAYMRRHQALGVAPGVAGRERDERLSVGRRVGGVIERRGRAKVERWMDNRRHGKPAPDVKRRVDGKAGAGSSNGRSDSDSEVNGSKGSSVARPRASSKAERHQDRHAQLARVHQARATAEAAGDTRRAATLRSRGQRIEQEIAQERAPTRQAETVTARVTDREQPEEAQRIRSDRSAGRTSHGAEGSSDPEPTPMAGFAGARHEQHDGRERREARTEIDRELARSKELGGSAGDAHEVSVQNGPPRADQTHESSGDVEIPRRGKAEEPRIMRDAREVQAGRKRQLGPGRP